MSTLPFAIPEYNLSAYMCTPTITATLLQRFYWISEMKNRPDHSFMGG